MLHVVRNATLQGTPQQHLPADETKRRGVWLASSLCLLGAIVLASAFRATAFAPAAGFALVPLILALRLRLNLIEGCLLFWLVGLAFHLIGTDWLLVKGTPASVLRWLILAEAVAVYWIPLFVVGRHLLAMDLPTAFVVPALWTSFEYLRFRAGIVYLNAGQYPYLQLGHTQLTIRTGGRLGGSVGGDLSRCLGERSD